MFAGILMLIWVAAAVFTVGLFYLPVAVWLLWPGKHRHDENGMPAIR